MTKDEALKLALDKKADNARELGLDYEPENTLHWHALNYRTAPTQNAQAMFEALEKFVEAAIKKALRENAMREVQRLGQEPVAWKLPDKNVVFWEDTKEVDEYHGFEPTIPLYPHPQRTWVGLTAGEILDTLISVDEKTVRLPSMLGQFACAIEAKLKQKNGYAEENT